MSRDVKWRVGPVLWGAAVFASLALSLFAAWLWSARIGDALHLQGQIEPAGGSWQITHQDGGTIAEIFIKDGDSIEKGAPILRIDGQDLRAEQSSLRAQLSSVAAQLARLRAERDGTAELAMPSVADALAGPQFDAEMQAQKRLMSTRAARMAAELDELDLQRARNADQRHWLHAQLDAVAEEAELVAQVIASQERLSSQGLTTANRLLPLQQQRAALNRTRLQAEGQLAELDNADEEAALRRARLLTQQREDIMTEIRTLEPRALDLRARLDMVEARLARLTLTAPTSGTIHALRFRHPGAAAEAGQPLGAIVPATAAVIAVVRLPTAEISEVREGQEAYIQTLRDAHDGAPPNEAILAHISADSLTSRPDQPPHYRIEFALKEANASQLRPGMPVQILVKMPAKRAITFLTAPISGFFARAFPGRQPSQP